MEYILADESTIHKMIQEKKLETEASYISNMRASGNYRVEEGTAIIDVAGPLRKGYTFFGTSYDDIVYAIKQAESDSSVTSLRLNFNSGGGGVTGVAVVAEALANFSKPTVGHINNCCSACYYIAAQCDELIAEENAVIGSIGTVIVVEDWSKAFENFGIKVEVISSGPYKGMGALGTSLTDDQKAKVQEHVDKVTENFKAAVMSGRNMPQETIDALATGEVWVAKDAMKLGLIDSVDNSFSSKANSRKGNLMEKNEQALAEAKQAGESDGIVKGKAQAVSDLEKMTAQFPNDLNFAISQFKAGASLVEAKAAYADILLEKNAALVVKNAELEALAEEQVETAEATATGEEEGIKHGKPKASTTVTELTPESFSQMVKEYMAENKCSKIDAIKAVNTNLSTGV